MGKKAKIFYSNYALKIECKKKAPRGNWKLKCARNFVVIKFSSIDLLC